jgi:hypothetical protein|tara:strand:+ start:111 stop:401 length:291 start_codon:yes stop_codon:yes gene_type:complete
MTNKKIEDTIKNILPNNDRSKLINCSGDDFFNISKKHNIKVVMCGDDETIPKIIHARIKSTCDEIMDPFSDVKWKDVYSIMEDIYKKGVKHGKDEK